MSQTTVKEVTYKEFGKCVEISNGSVELVVTVDCGPRIIRFGVIGGENEFCDNASLVVDVGNEKYYLRGGHRLWHSPEGMPRSYSPDNKPVEWTRIENGIRVSQEVEPWVQMKKELEITLESCCNRVKVIHHMINKNAWAVELSAWGLSVMATGGLEVVPQPKRETGLLGNRTLALWPYSKMNDHRIYWGDNFITLKQDPNTQPAIKFGINNEDGWAAYFNHGNLFIKRYEYFMDKKYPDFGVSYETYTTDFMLEMESLSPLTLLQPDSEIVHTEEWELIKGVERPEAKDECAIAEVVEKHIKKGCCCK
jgi:hypothetical protein